MKKDYGFLLWLVPLLGVVGYFIYVFYTSRSKMLSNMEKVREAKAEKAVTKKAVEDLETELAKSNGLSEN